MLEHVQQWTIIDCCIELQVFLYVVIYEEVKPQFVHKKSLYLLSTVRYKLNYIHIDFHAVSAAASVTTI